MTADAARPPAAAWAFRPPAFRRVSITDVSRAFGRVHALYRCTAALNAGQVTAIVGPNGAGKTTLLHLLATLDRPDDGTIRFGDAVDSVRDRAVVRPHIGLVAHDSLLYADLSGRENLRFTAEMYDRDAGEADTWLTRVGLDAAADRAVGTYSRGMRQRLSIARALLPEPTLVLFDEPLTGLDRDARAFFFETVTRLRAAERIVVVVTHHLAWPADAVDAALLLERGRAVYAGPADRPLATLYAECAS